MVPKSALEEQVYFLRFFYGFWCVCWCIWWYQGLLLTQLYGQPLVFPGADNFYWLVHLSGFVDLFKTSFFSAVLLDSLLIILPLSVIILPQKSWIRWCAFCAFLIYFVVYHSFMGHHGHTKNALLAMALLCVAKSPKRFFGGVEALRFYVCFVLFSAFLWKLFRGSVWHEGQMVEILKQQHLGYVINCASCYYTSFIYWLIASPLICSVLWWGACLLEAAFCIGFFTKRWDKLLMALFFMFFIMDYWIMNLSFFEFCIFALVFKHQPALEALWDTDN